MRHLDLFSGIGGFALATEMVWGRGNVEHIFCDNEPFAQAILKKHWPKSKIYGDIKTFTADSESDRRNRRISGALYEGKNKKRKSQPGSIDTQVDLLTGGFPCQPFSSAGARRGTEDGRHLWPEMLRVIREFKPRWIIGENVGGLVTWSGGLVLEQIHVDLETEGYEVQAFIIPAVAVNAPHRRDRVWIVAHSKSDDGRGRPRKVSRSHEQKEQKGSKKRVTKFSSTSSTNASNTQSNRSRGWSGESNQRKSYTEKRSSTWTESEGYNWDTNWSEVAAKLCTMDDGLPSGLPRPRGWRNAALKGAGNAIVPQVAAEIMKAIWKNSSSE